MSLLGHEAAWREWREAMAGKRMHHAWLLAGKRGLGKMHFALAAARALVDEPGVPQPGGPHPDIIVLTHLPKNEAEEKKRDEGKPYEVNRNIKVDQIREMQARLTTCPTLGSRRAVVIDTADDLERNASNALLKTLEEPPRGTFLLLVSHRPARLLPTIRSRCRTLRFAPLPDAAIAEMVAAQTPASDPQTRAAAVAAAGGSPGAALDFVAQNLGALGAIMKRIAREGDPDFALRGQLAEAIGTRPERERIMAVLDLARATLAGMVDRAPRHALPGLIEAHADLVILTAQTPTYNFDAGLLVMEIGTLLVQAAGHREPADA